MAIQSFADQATETLFRTGHVKKSAGWQNVVKIALRKLDMLHYASKLSDLMAPPNNRLEALKGPLKGCHSIRINDQWRLVFIWTENGPNDVRIIDYHK
ncbi:MAG: plasmid maintenance system killer protein [Bdellovibrio sp. 28-41-41]|nr:MAG: plasmid maintenance system killer protein [Bdellovibrio sp. 28-41-41]